MNVKTPPPFPERGLGRNLWLLKGGAFHAENRIIAKTAAAFWFIDDFSFKGFLDRIPAVGSCIEYKAADKKC